MRGLGGDLAANTFLGTPRRPGCDRGIQYVFHGRMAAGACSRADLALWRRRGSGADCRVLDPCDLDEGKAVL